MQKQPAQKNNNGFLEKFEGRKNTVSKEGLIHLLQLKRSKIDAPTLPTEKQKLNLVKDAKNQVSAQSLLDALEAKVNNVKKSKDGVSSSSFASNALKDRYAQLKEALEQPKSTELVSSKLKLPAINKSSSHTTHLHKNANDPITEQYGVASHRVRSLPRQPQSSDGLFLNNIPKKMQLDKYALRHLQFLEKFEKQVARNQAISKISSHSQH